MDGWREALGASRAVVGTLRVRPLPPDVSSTRPHCVLLAVTPSRQPCARLLLCPPPLHLKEIIYFSQQG